MSWAFFAILSSILVAMRAEASRRYKLDGFRLNLFTSLIISLLSSPVFFFAELPDFGSLLYPVVVICAIINIVGMTIKNNLGARFNGRVACMEMPIKTFVIFLLWFLFDVDAFWRLVDHPLRFLGVLMMLSLASFSMFKMRRSDVGWSTFIQIVPVALLFAMGDTLSKYVYEGYAGNIWHLTFMFIFLQSILAFIISALFLWVRPYVARPNETIPKLIVPGMLSGALFMGCLLFVSWVTFLYAIALVPNPAYVSALGMLIPVWLLAYHKVKDIKDDASPYMGTLLVLSALGLILITS